ncbi:hypothetical protein [uncultured Pontibacter sp.]|uniref:hypothetical protein n=1 Tax=uncultured Pontibacter sp. TaxID=453356 RepID=UPI00262766B6|nr:hypothetical protein [uncultured Pontibacter sp.]
MTTAELSEYLSIRLLNNDTLLHTTWLRSVNSIEYRDSLSLIKKLILEKDIRLWLSDSRQLSHVTFEDQQWIMKEILPLLLKSRLEKVARVVKSDVFSYITFENLMRKAQENYNFEAHMEQFTSVDAALAWLYLNE